MGKRLEYTPNSAIKAALRALWLRSRERAAAIKRDEYTCSRCGAKQSKAKGREVLVEVHHKEGVMNWNEIYRVIRQYLLCGPENMETLCKDCHKEVYFFEPLEKEISAEDMQKIVDANEKLVRRSKDYAIHGK